MGAAKSNLHILAEYSNKMDAGDTDAVYEYWSDDFMSHVTERVSPEMVGKDVRHKEREFWDAARAAFPDMDFKVELVLETGDFVVSNWTLKGTHTGTA